MQIIGRESGPALFFFLDFFAGAASKMRNNNITITPVSTTSVFRTLNLQSMDKSLGTLLHFWGIFQFTNGYPLPSSHKQH